MFHNRRNQANAAYDEMQQEAFAEDCAHAQCSNGECPYHHQEQEFDEVYQHHQAPPPPLSEAKARRPMCDYVNGALSIGKVVLWWWLSTRSCHK